MDTVISAVKVVANLTADDVSRQTTQASLSPEEEDAIVSLIVIVVGIVAAIIILFSMGIFMDCRHRTKTTTKKKKLRLKMPPLGRARKMNEDSKSFASDMCPNGKSDFASIANTRDMIV